MRKCSQTSNCLQKVSHIVLHPNINFSVNKQNKISKTDPKVLKQ